MMAGMNWPVFSLGNVCSVRRGTTITQNQATPGVIPVVAGGLAPTYFHDTPNRVGNVITVSASGANAGFVNYWENRIFASDCSTVESEGPDVIIKYVFHFLREKQEYIYSKLRSGAAQPHVYAKDIAALEIPLPPLPEQRRIAAILDQADALRAKRREALAQLDSLTQSIFIQMFGAPLRNPKGWETVRLGDHTLKIGSGSTPTGGDAAYKKSGISLIRSLNVHDGKFIYKNLAHIDEQQAAKLANVKVEEGDVLLNITGASIARVCLVPKDILPARVNQHVMIIRPKPAINSIYLERLFLRPEMKRKLLQIGGAGATREAITKAQAEELKVICPPISLQLAFAKRMSVLENNRLQQLSSISELDTLFASLQHRAFRGEL